jgi:hypothetical protein
MENRLFSLIKRKLEEIMSSQHPWKKLMLSSKVPVSLASLVVLALLLRIPVHAQDKSAEIAQKLSGFDAFLEKTLKDWNAPGIGVGIVVNDRLVFAKGYGYRDYEKKLPITPTTLFPIASNTKLFTAVAAGFLVEEGKLSQWVQVSGSDETGQRTLHRVLRTAGSKTDPLQRAQVSR